MPVLSDNEAGDEPHQSGSSPSSDVEGAAAVPPGRGAARNGEPIALGALVNSQAFNTAWSTLACLILAVITVIIFATGSMNIAYRIALFAAVLAILLFISFLRVCVTDYYIRCRRDQLEMAPSYEGLVAVSYLGFPGASSGINYQPSVLVVISTPARTTASDKADGYDGEPLEILPNVPEGLVILGANDTTCVVCWERAASLAFVPCGHACVCWNAQCSSLKKCPLCRSEATQLCKVSTVQNGDLTELRSKTLLLNSKAPGSSHDLEANDPEILPSNTATTAQASSDLTSVTTEVYAESASSDPEPTDDEESPSQSH